MDTLVDARTGVAGGAEMDVAIGGMTCASCAGRVERALTRVPGVLGAEVNLATDRARVRVTGGAVTFDQLVAAVSDAGYEASAVAPAS
jgi:Cu+-exporting ATPase